MPSRCDTLPRTLAAPTSGRQENGGTFGRGDNYRCAGGCRYARVTLRGDRDPHAVQRVRTELGGVLDTGARYLTVDLAGVNGCDESVLDALGWAARRACAQQGWLALAGVNHHFQFAVHGHRLRVDNGSPQFVLPGPVARAVT